MTSMPPTTLRLELRSPALFTGASTAGTRANTDVITDPHGLPYFPRHRLAARLREGAVTAIRAGGGEPLLRCAEALLGTTRGGHEGTRILRLGHAHPAAEVRAAVAWAMQQRPDRLGVQADARRRALAAAITAAYTCYESGTEVDALGAPVSGRLRTHRSLRPGLVLWAELRWAGDCTEERLRLLARAALATTTAGLKITRGRGRIDVRIADPSDASAEAAHDHTRRMAGLGPAPAGEGEAL